MTQLQDRAEVAALQERMEALKALIEESLAKSEEAEETTAPSPETTSASVSLVMPKEMKARLEKFAKAKRTTPSDIVRRAVADAVGFDLDTVEMRTRGRRRAFRNDEERKAAAKLQYEQNKAILKAAKQALNTADPVGDYIKNRMRELGVPTLAA